MNKSNPITIKNVSPTTKPVMSAPNPMNDNKVINAMPKAWQSKT